MIKIQENRSEEFEKNYIEWQKAFVAGSQFTSANFLDGKLEEDCKQFYWQDDQVFNIIKTRVNGWEADYDENWLWGVGKAVDQLIPYQKQYNAIMTSITLLVRRLVNPLLLVEDGSVDVDELSEEGLAPGKLLVYRQGAKIPDILNTTTAQDIQVLRGVALSIKEELTELMDTIEESFK